MEGERRAGGGEGGWGVGPEVGLCRAVGWDGRAAGWVVIRCRRWEAWEAKSVCGGSGLVGEEE